jgi:hypothetical protein
MLLLLVVRLSLHAGPGRGCAGLFLAYFAAGLGLTWWCARRPTPLRWRVRLSWYFVAMGLVFYTLPSAIGVLGVGGADAMLQAADRMFLFMPVADCFLGLQSAALTDLMVLAYLFFFWYLLFGPGYYCFQDLRRFRLCIVGMFCIYAVGLFSYSLLPAGGPHLALHFAAPLPAGPLGRLMLPVIDGGSNGVDVFPSIHVAISAYLLGFDARHYRPRFRWLLLPCALLWISTLYLRYHYLTDLFAGAALALAGLGLTRLYESSYLERGIEHEAQQLAATA